MELRSITKIYAVLCLLVQCCFSYAEVSLLPVEQAFQFSSESLSTTQAQLSWKIAPKYYLYQHKFSVSENGKPLRLDLPKAVSQHDENFGITAVYFDHITTSIHTLPNKTYSVAWQGCAKDRLCYPPQHINFKTDPEGLITLENEPIQNKTSLLELSQNQTKTPESSPKMPVAQDQQFADQLQSHSFIYSVLLFLGLGMLLAFTPCSLPMLPILSSLIIREHKGVKAWSVAFVFVCSMAVVYAILGMVAASAGLGFQRWLQQPTTLIAFSTLFIVFALNLFGLFEIKLPQKLTNRLDHMQSTQKGGSLLGAGIMGVISALLVGPCMTAPLAGALLFIAQQTQNQWQGAVFLFALGFGMGIPLLVISILGAKVLPKAGTWMVHIKVIFAFIMLGLALYFIRPLLAFQTMHIASLLLIAIFVIYLFYGILKYAKGLKILYILLLCLVVPFGIYQQVQYQNGRQVAQQTVWHTARTASEFEELLKNAPKDQAVVIDVYADWCTACQPIEHKILKREDVQIALRPFYLIKIDLSQYDDSHQNLLKQWEVLGPPTYLFLDQDHQERRDLRLTGEFETDQLLHQLGQLVQR